MAKKTKAKKMLSVVVSGKDQSVFSFGELDTNLFKTTLRQVAATKEVKSVTVRPAPRVSKDEDGNVLPGCLQAVTQLTGQALMGFASKLDREFTNRVITEVTRKIMSGEISITSMTKAVNGRGGLRWKPTNGGVMTEEQHAMALGLTLEQVKSAKAEARAAAKAGKPIDVAAQSELIEEKK